MRCHRPGDSDREDAGESIESGSTFDVTFLVPACFLFAAGARRCETGGTGGDGFLSNRDHSQGRMFTLFHHPFCPHSRFIRLVLGEYGLDVQLAEEADLGTARGLSCIEPRGHHPGAVRRGPAAYSGRGDHRRIY